MVGRFSAVATQVCDALGPAGCGGFTRNMGKYGAEGKTHCFLYPAADVAANQTVVTSQGDLFIKPGLPMMSGGCAAPPPPPPVEH